MLKAGCCCRIPQGIKENSDESFESVMQFSLLTPQNLGHGWPWPWTVMAGVPTE